MCSAGLTAEVWGTVELRSTLPVVTHKAVGGRFIENDAQLSPRRLALAFVEAARQAGAVLRRKRVVSGFVRDEHSAISGVQTQDKTISARYVILSTNV